MDEQHGARGGARGDGGLEMGKNSTNRESTWKKSLWQK